MYIGEVSKLSGASPKAIRLYESMGLLSGIKRQGSYRIYEKSDVDFIKLIKEAQLLGVSLSDLKGLVIEKNELDWLAVIEFLVQKQVKVDADIMKLKEQRKKMTEYRRNIENCINGH